METRIEVTYATVYDKENDIRVELYFSQDNKTWKINWAGCGSQSIAFTSSFIKVLEKAVNLAEDLTSGKRQPDNHCSTCGKYMFDDDGDICEECETV